MSIGIIGKKVGMTRIFDEDGKSIAVTVIDVSDNEFVQHKTEEKDGYSAVQVAYDEQKEHRLNSPQLGHIKKHGGSSQAHRARISSRERRAASRRSTIPEWSSSKRDSGST